MAHHCAWCGSTDTQAITWFRQCFVCGKRTTETGEKVEDHEPHGTEVPDRADALDMLRKATRGETTGHNSLSLNTAQLVLALVEEVEELRAQLAIETIAHKGAT